MSRHDRGFEPSINRIDCPIVTTGTLPQPCHVPDFGVYGGRLLLGEIQSTSRGAVNVLQRQGALSTGTPAVTALNHGRTLCESHIQCVHL